MKEKLRKVISSNFVFYGAVLIIIIAAGYFFYAYRHADEVKVESLKEESAYPVYSGRNAYEYWRSTLSENQQVLYDEIKETELQFKREFSTQAKGEITQNDLSETFTAVKLDHPEIFWINTYNNSLTLKDTVNKNRKIEIIYKYNLSEAKEIKSEIEKSYQPIIDGAMQQENDFKKIKYVHDELIKLATYQMYEDDQIHDYQTIISIFRDKKTVCAGYTHGFKFIMDQLGINSVSVMDAVNDDPMENHIWNMVNLYGKWYNLDITYDRHYTEGEVVAYNYFLKDNDTFYVSHKMPKNIPEN